MHTRYTHLIAIGLLVLAGLLATACGADEIDLSVAPVDAAEPRSDVTATVAISPLSGPPGAIVEVVASGFPANAHVSVGAGPGNLGFVEVAEGTTDADGFLSAQVEAQGAPGMALVFAVSAAGQPSAISPDRFLVTEKTSSWTGDAIELVDGSGKIVARVGEEIVLRGGPIPKDWESKIYRHLYQELPGDCHGPYWVVED